METPHFEETQPLNWPVLFLIPAIIAAAIGISQTPEDAPINWIGFGFLIIAGGAAVLGFRRMTTIVTSTELRFGYPVWRQRLPLSGVRVGEIQPIRAWRGVGIHWFGGTWVYNAHLGRGVEVFYKETRYIIGSREPERLQGALLQKVPRQEN